MYRDSAHAVPAIDAFEPTAAQLAGALAVALIAQSLQARYAAPRDIVIGVVSMLVAWYGLRSGPAAGAFFGLIAGLCEDALVGNSGAAWTFANTICGLGAGLLARTRAGTSLAGMVPALALLGLVREFAYVLALRMHGEHAAALTLALHTAVRQMLVDVPVAYCVLRALPRLCSERVVDR